MKRKSGIFVWMLGLGFLAGVGVFIASQLNSKKPTEHYITAPVDRADIEQAVSATGTLNPVKLVNVGTQISGVVSTLHADFNDQVSEGQLLAELDQSLLKATLQQSEGTLSSARAKLKQAKSNFSRVKSLYDHDYVARADLDVARQQLETAQAEVKSTEGQVMRDQVNIGYSLIKSPVSGVIISRNVNVGQTVAASFQTPTLFVIAQDLKQMQIDSNLSEADVGNVKDGMKVKFTVDAFPNREFAGNVRQVRLNPTTQQNVVTYNVVIDVSNDDLTLLPGMTTFVTLIEDQKSNVLRIPNAALTFHPSTPNSTGSHKTKPVAEADSERTAKDSKPVYLLRDGVPKRIIVKTGISDHKFTEIVGGDIGEGDQVIVDEELAAGKNGKKSGFPPAGGPPRMF